MKHIEENTVTICWSCYEKDHSRKTLAVLCTTQPQRGYCTMHYAEHLNTIGREDWEGFSKTIASIREVQASLLKSDILSRGMWQIAYKAVNVLCEDGKQRNATITAQPDTMFSIPAIVQVRGKSVSGFITYNSDLEVHTFLAYTHKKNGYLLAREETK